MTKKKKVPVKKKKAPPPVCGQCSKSMIKIKSNDQTQLVWRCPEHGDMIMIKRLK